MKSTVEKELRLLLVKWKAEDKESAKLAKSKPEYRDHFLGQEVGLMRHRVDLEVLLTKLGKTYPTTFDSDATDVSHKPITIDI